MYHISSFSSQGNHFILQFTHNWIESVKSLLFNFCNCITVKKPTGKVILVKQLSTCTTIIKMSYMHCKLEFGIRL